MLARHGPEGSVQCDQARDQGQDRAMGSSISQRRSTLDRFCAVGVTLCQLLGYRFVNGDVADEVSEDRGFKISRAGKVLLEEPGLAGRAG